MTGMVHIAGPQVRVGNQLRQRCSWCGTTLEDYDLERTAVAVSSANPDPDPTPAAWPTGGLVEVDGCVSRTVDHLDGERLPPNACAQLDHVVTR